MHEVTKVCVVLMLFAEPALSAEQWLAGENATVKSVSMDPSKRQNKPVNKKVEAPSKQPTQEKTVEASPSKKDPKPSEVANEAGVIDKPVLSTESSNDKVSVKEEEKPSNVIADSSDQQVPEGNVASEELPQAATNNSTTSDVKPVAKKLPKYGGTNVSPYKYILGKPYHPSKHYVDLRGLSNDKSGATELIQVTTVTNQYYILFTFDINHFPLGQFKVHSRTYLRSWWSCWNYCYC